MFKSDDERAQERWWTSDADCFSLHNMFMLLYGCDAAAAVALICFVD